MLDPAGRLAMPYRVGAGLIAVICVPATVLGALIAATGVHPLNSQQLVVGGLAFVGGLCGMLGFGAAAITGRNMDWPASIRALRGR